jgi:hypothetical protein
MNLSLPCLRIVAIAMISFFAPTVEAGEETHYQDHLVGERAAAMGGANIAMADEATGAHYNPAGIVGSGSTLLQVSMSAYKLQMTRAEIARICDQRYFDERKDFFGFPASLGFVTLFGDKIRHALGLHAVIYSMSRGQSAFQIDRIPCDLNNNLTVGGSHFEIDRSMGWGMTYAIRPIPMLRIGLSINFTLRSVSSATSITSATNTATGKSTQIEFLNLKANLFNSHLRAGILLEPFKGFSIGLSFSTPHFALVREGVIDTVMAGADAQGNPVGGGVSLDDATFNWKVPFVVAFGVAYQRKESFAVALDIKLHGPLARYPVFTHSLFNTQGLTTVTNQRNLVVNFNIGGEFYLNPKWILRAGFFSNFSSYPVLEKGAVQDQDHLHMYGVTFGGTYRSSDTGTLSLILQAQYGTGQSMASWLASTGGNADGSASSEVVDARDISLVVSVGGSFDLSR